MALITDVFLKNEPWYYSEFYGKKTDLHPNPHFEQLVYNIHSI